LPSYHLILSYPVPNLIPPLPLPLLHQRRPKKGSRRCNNSQTSGEERALYGRAAPVMSDLPPKWSEAKDTDSGDTYFWNTDTNETSWDRPIAPSTAGPAPPPPPPRRREAVAAPGRHSSSPTTTTSCDDPEQLLLNPPDPNLICPICLKLFTQPVRTACGCARRLEPVPSTTHLCLAETHLTLPSGTSVLTVRALR